MIQFLVANPIITACIWAVMYIFDYSATLWFARLYQQSLNRHFTYESGMELNPVFEKDIAGLRVVSPRFLILLSLMTLVLVFFGRFEFMVGAFLLLWIFLKGL
jgi:hypothetical protein